MSLGQLLRNIRERKKVTQKELANRISMDAAYLCKIEKGRFSFPPSRNTINKIAKGLNCDKKEKNKLLTAAGRVDTEIEDIMYVVQARPDIADLLKLLIKRSEEDIENLIYLIKEV